MYAARRGERQAQWHCVLRVHARARACERVWARGAGAGAGGGAGAGAGNKGERARACGLPAQTHEPCVTPVLISLRAAGSCPWPSEMERTAVNSLRELHDERGRVGAHREDGDDRAAAVRLLLDSAHVERPRVDEALADGVGDVVLRREDHSVVAHAPHEQQPLKVAGDAARLGERRRLLLGRVVVVPRAPLVGARPERLDEVGEGGGRGRGS